MIAVVIENAVFLKNITDGVVAVAMRRLGEILPESAGRNKTGVGILS